MLFDQQSYGASTTRKRAVHLADGAIALQQLEGKSLSKIHRATSRRASE